LAKTFLGGDFYIFPKKGRKAGIFKVGTPINLIPLLRKNWKGLELEGVFLPNFLTQTYFLEAQN